MPRWAITLLSLAVLIGLWEFFGRDINPVFGSYPSAIAAAFVELVRTGQLGAALYESLRPFVVGYGLAIVIGVPLGLVIGRFRVVEAEASDHQAERHTDDDRKAVADDEWPQTLIQ